MVFLLNMLLISVISFLFIIFFEGTMFTVTLTTISSFKMVLFCKNYISLFWSSNTHPYLIGLFSKSSSSYCKKITIFVLMFIKSQEISHPLFLEKEIQLFIKRIDLIHPYISGNKFYKLKYNIFRSFKTKYKYNLNFWRCFILIIYLHALHNKKDLKV